MLISDSSRLLFVHVQKTGGSTIDRTLSAGLPDVRRIAALDRHAPLGAVLRHEPALSPYWIVGFVRNPWARMLSWHRMVVRFHEAAAAGSEQAEERLRRNPFLSTVRADFLDFEDFVMAGPERFHRLTVPQVRYLTTAGRRADFVGRQESLEADMRAVRARLGLPLTELQDINVDRARPDYREVYTDAMRERVATIFARDLAVFDYRF